MEKLKCAICGTVEEVENEEVLVDSDLGRKVKAEQVLCKKCKKDGYFLNKIGKDFRWWSRGRGYENSDDSMDDPESE